MTNHTPAQLREMTADDLLEAVAQMLYDRAEIASNMEDESVTEPIKQRYREKYLTYCGAAEHVRAMLRE